MPDGDASLPPDDAAGGKPTREGTTSPTGDIAPPYSAYPDSLAAPNELLIHPDDARHPDDDDPYGSPGAPIARHSAFYVGFIGGLGALLAIALGLAFLKVQGALVLVVVAAFIAVGLNPLVEWFMHRGLRRPWSVFIVALCVLGFITLFVVALVPVLRDQITTIIDDVPGWLDELRSNSTVQDLDEKYDIIDTVNSKIQSADFATTAFGSIFSVGLAVLGALFNAFLIFVLTLYFLAALPTIKRAAYSLAPASRRERVASLGDEVLRSVGGFVSGAFVVALCAGVSSFIFLEIVGLGRYAVALALVVAILDFIPLIGATLGATVVTLIAFATSLPIGITCIVFFVIYQQLENYVIYPRVMRSSVDVPGVVTVIAVLLGGALMGVVGAMLAIPTAAATLLIIREVFVRKQDAS
jgi:predicted PurR-regulated permease PerM